MTCACCFSQALVGLVSEEEAAELKQQLQSQQQQLHAQQQQQLEQQQLHDAELQAWQAERGTLQQQLADAQHRRHSRLQNSTHSSCSSYRQTLTAMPASCGT